jgi:hypothetical protein
MSLENILFKLPIFASLVQQDPEVERILTENKSKRAELDRRLDDVTKATINGEEDWFLELVKKDPACVLNVIKECDLDGTDK